MDTWYATKKHLLPNGMCITISSMEKIKFQDFVLQIQNNNKHRSLNIKSQEVKEGSVNKLNLMCDKSKMVKGLGHNKQLQISDIAV